MNITSNLFEAYLKCPTKCFLRSRGEAGAENEYADWVRVQTEFYRNGRSKDLKSIAARDGRTITGGLKGNRKPTEQEYAFDFVAQAANLESHIHFIERTPPKDPDTLAQFVPTRFIYTNKINKDDKLLLGFDALALSETLGREVRFGKIIHGDDHTTVKVKTSALAKQLRQLIAKINSLLSNNSPPDLVLNRHCAECEFRARCRNKAIEADDLSLLSAMTEKERSRHRSKGIFTVNQLSYTFRPRKAPKRAKTPAKPHYLALQALSLRENTVYVHGNPQLPTSDCKIFLDIEGLPDSEFYYLIGVLLVINGQESFHSFWAEEKSDEPNIFAQFVETVSAMPDFRIYHFGNYETIALRRAKQKLPKLLRPKVDAIIERSINVLSVVYPHIYFPTYSNSLKEIGRFLGYARIEEDVTGLQTIGWRKDWEASKDFGTKHRLIQYNQDDCIQLKRLCEFLASLNSTDLTNTARDPTLPKLTRTEELRKDRPHWRMFGAKEYALEDFKHVVKCAYFDYQREKIFFRTDLPLKTINKQHRKLKRTKLRPNQKLVLEARKCLRCRSGKIEHRKHRTCVLIDLRFSESGVKKWITQAIFSQYYCFKCTRQFSSGEGDRRPYVKYGHGLMSWCVYWNVIGGLNMSRVAKGLADLFGLFLPHAAVHRFKAYVVDRYLSLYNEILKTLLVGPIIHVDETVVNLRGNNGYVWVMASMDKVYYFYRPSREGSFLEGMLAPFNGILISDFFSAYDSLSCEQQKCLVHFVRDIDDDLLRNPVDTELKALAQDFGNLLKRIISTVDRYGLKRRHLQKHTKEVDRFLNTVASVDYSSELANKYKKRFGKSGVKMFTFLAHDGVPWNNNNAEHAIKRFAKHRRNADGRFTQTSLDEYLVLASILATCEFNNVNGLKFLLSKETTLEGLLKIAGRKTNSSPTETQITETRPH